MFWSVWAGTGAGAAAGAGTGAVGAEGARIEAAAMDASRRRTLLHDDLHWPNGLVIDLQTRYLYW